MGKGRSPCCDKSKVKSGPWSPSEDLKLISFIQNHGHANWRALPAQAGLLRCGKSCRLRWINYLRPDLRRGNITIEEEEMIIKLHETYGNKWSKIASFLPGRTDNEIKNIWNTHIVKKLGIRCGRSRVAKRKKSQDTLDSTSMSFDSHDGKNDQYDKIDMSVNDIKVCRSRGLEAILNEDENEQGESPTPSTVTCLTNVLNFQERDHGQMDFNAFVESTDINGSEAMDELAFLTTHDFDDLDFWNALDLNNLSAIDDQCVDNEDKAPEACEGFASNEAQTKEPNTSNVELSSWVRLLEIELGLDA